MVSIPNQRHVAQRQVKEEFFKGKTTRNPLIPFTRKLQKPKSCSALSRLNCQGELKIFPEYLHSQVTEAKM